MPPAGNSIVEPSGTESRNAIRGALASSVPVASIEAGTSTVAPLAAAAGRTAEERPGQPADEHRQAPAGGHGNESAPEPS